MVGKPAEPPYWAGRPNVLFPVLTGDIWAASLKDARSRPNLAWLQIKKKLDETPPSKPDPRN
jgi:hypothetical protein